VLTDNGEPTQMSLMNAMFGRRRYGERSTLEKWNSEYRSGRWDWLGRLDELAHIAILGGYVRQLSPAGGAILDVGCGEGLLIPHVMDHTARYVGIDGAAAVDLAVARRPRMADFCVADMNDFVPNAFFNAIVFCESIYYLNPLDVKLRRYLNALTPEGVLLVSVHARRKHDYIWRELDQMCETLDAVHVTNSHGTAWNVRAMRPRPAR
jgi:SAM-dependent methyltransferase